MVLDNRNAIIYGGGGKVGGAIARAFAAAGATVHLAGRTQATLDRVAEDIRTAGGKAETAVVDALDERSVEQHADRVGRIDISVNVVSDNDVQGIALVDISVDDFMRPVQTAIRSKFITSRAAARRMIPRRSGVIMAFGGGMEPDAMTRWRLGGMSVAFDGVETLRRQLASELGPHGIRVITLRTGGIVETLPADFEGRDRIEADVIDHSRLGRAATLADVGAVAVFAASDAARTLTGAAINMSCGAWVD